jgi:WD40 repeat protein
MKFLKDGRLVTEWDVSRTNVWNITTGRLDTSLAIGAVSMEELDSGLLATSYPGGNIYIWNITDGSLVSSIEIPQQQNFLHQTCLANYLASIDINGVLYMWNLVNNKRVWRQTLGSATPVTMGSMKNGNLVTVMNNGWIRIWNVLTGVCYNSFKPLNSTINGATMFDDELVVGSELGLVMVLQIDLNSQFSLIATYNTPGAVKDLRVTPENILLVAVNGSVCLFDLNIGIQIDDYTFTTSDNIFSLANFGWLI